MSFVRALFFALFISLAVSPDFSDLHVSDLLNSKAFAKPLVAHRVADQRVADQHVGDQRVDSRIHDTVDGGIVPFQRTADAIKSALPDSGFNIDMPQVISQPERLTKRVVYSKNIAQRNQVPGPFADYTDFKNRGISLEPIEVVSYGILGRPDVFIETPLAYSEQIESQKNSGDASQFANMKSRLTLDQLPRFIDELPDSSYFNHILLSDRANPEDDWSTQTYFSSGFVAVTAMFKDGRLLLFKMKATDPYLRTDFIHEWNHQLKYKYESDPLFTAFKDAVEIEKGWSPNRYANRSATEYFAVLGERLLSTNSSEFLEACQRAPVKTALWMLILNKALLHVPPAHQSVNHSQYLKRVDHVVKNVLPVAKSQMSAMNGGVDAQKLHGIEQALSATE